MTISEFKKIARVLKEVYAEIEKQAIFEGIDIFSEEYKTLTDKAREGVLNKAGFTLEEYRIIKDSYTPANKQKVNQQIEIINSEIEDIKSTPPPNIPTKEDIFIIAHQVAKEYIKPPQITNQIVKEITKEVTVERPKIIETTRQTVVKEKYNAKPLEEKLSKLESKIENIKIPEPVDIELIKSELKLDFNEELKHNIDILGMPDFRKLAMGLQAQIDVIDISGGGIDGTMVLNRIPYGLDADTLQTSANLTYNGTYLSTPTARFSTINPVSTSVLIGDLGSGSYILSDVGNSLFIIQENFNNISYNGSTFDVTGTLKASNLTASRLLVSDASKNIISSSATATEAGYLSGVTSAIQTQLDNKLAITTAASTYLPLVGGTLTGNLFFSADNTYDIGGGSTNPRSGYFATSLTAPYLYGGDKTGTTYTGYSGAVLGGFTTHAVLDFFDNNVRIGEFYTTSSAFNFFTGTGSSLNFYVNNDTTNAAIAVATSREITLLGNLLMGTDNTYDIGASGATRPRTGYFGTSVVTPLLTLGTGNITMTGSIASTGSRVTKVWTADLESTNMPTVGGTSLSSIFQGLDTQLTSLAGLSYTGNALKVIRVNAGETDFELATLAGGSGLTHPEVMSRVSLRF